MNDELPLFDKEGSIILTILQVSTSALSQISKKKEIIHEINYISFIDTSTL